MSNNQEKKKTANRNRPADIQVLEFAAKFKLNMSNMLRKIGGDGQNKGKY